jgi:hypothetical protein
MISRVASQSLQNFLLDAASEKAAGVFQAPKDGTINKVGFLARTVTTGDTVDVRLETVSDANGDPTGTLLDTNTNASQVIGSGDDNTWFLTTLTAGAAVSKGDKIAVVIVNGAAPGDLNIGVISAGNQNFPYPDHFTAAWAKNNGRSPVFALEYSDGSYAIADGVFPVSAKSNETLASNTTPDERGLKFKLPIPFRVTKCWFEIDPNDNFDVVLYDSDDSVLETYSFDKDISATSNIITTRITFASPHELLEDTFYRITIKPSTTTLVTLGEFDVDTAAIMDSFDGGQDFHHTSRTDGGAWTDTTTKRPLMGLLIDAFDDGVGGGAASILSGGFGL